MHFLHIPLRTVVYVVILVMALSSGSLALAQDPVPNLSQGDYPQSPVVAQVFFKNTENLDQLASYLDIWEVNHSSVYLVALLSPEQFKSLQQAGYQVMIDQSKTDLLFQPHPKLPGQGVDTIPGYPCYRTVEETYADLQSTADNYPNLAEIYDWGDSWDKATPGGPDGYDILALRLTNESFGDPGVKPTFFLMAEIHAREYATAETAMLFAEDLVSGYGLDPDITWLLDYYRIYIVTMTNPDGRKFAELGKLWRKNTDSVAGGGCLIDPYTYGIDLNRNHSFHWGGASPQPCHETYQGPTSASEPETQSIQDHVSTLFPDQRGPADTDPAPLSTSGIFITLHSYGPLVLWPWGWTDDSAPNSTQLATLGRHLAFFNNSTPEQAVGLYPTTGSSDDWSYGELGIASYTFEMGSDFFQSCNSFDSAIYPGNRDALLYAFKAARRPYINPAGPDTYNVTVNPNTTASGSIVTLTATVNDTRFRDVEPSQNIAAAHYSIDSPSWITGVITYPMSATDGSFDGLVEEVSATINTTGFSSGRHTIFIESMDANGNWGVPGAVFMDIIPAAPLAEFSHNDPISLGQPAQFINQTTGNPPLTYGWNFGDGIGTSTETNPIYMYNALGTYTVTLVATNSLGTDSIAHTVNINPPIITSVDLTQVTSNPIYLGDWVEFSLDLTPDTGDLPFDYSINFGDGIISGLATQEPLVIKHAFTSPGSYPIEVWVQNTGMMNPVSDTLHVAVFTRIFLPLTHK